MADTAGDEPHEHLAGARLRQVDLPHDERRPELLEDSGPDLHLPAILRQACFTTR